MLDSGLSRERSVSWPAPPSHSVAYFANVSKAIVVGHVQSATELFEESDQPFYCIRLNAEEILKGPAHLTSIVIRVDYGKEPLGNEYRPEIGAGERVILFLFDTGDEGATYAIGNEDKIWRVDGSKVYNRWEERVRKSKITLRLRGVPVAVLKAWGRSYDLDEFLELVEKAISGGSTAGA